MLLIYLAVVVGMVSGQQIHIRLDRHPQRGTLRRRRELGVIWITAGAGFWILLSGLLYLDPRSVQLAPEARLEPGLVHWELAWADIAVSVLLLGCVLARNRQGWMNAAVVAFLIVQLSDAVATLLQVFGVRPYTNVMVASMFVEATQVILVLVYFRAYRRLPAPPGSPTSIEVVGQPAVPRHALADKYGAAAAGSQLGMGGCPTWSGPTSRDEFE